jgi:hypothetical protein
VLRQIDQKRHSGERGARVVYERLQAFVVALQETQRDLKWRK